MVAIIDYGAGNIKSVEKALQSLGQEVLVTKVAEEILSADKVILPGVGAFGVAMKRLEELKLVDVIREVVNREIPLLGICLGLQLLFESSEEAAGVAGLGILKGRVRKFDEEMGLKVPHMGWNGLHLVNDGKLFRKLNDGDDVYFVHSYYLESDEPEIVKARANYGVDFPASVECGEVYACQFHPEKSGDVGLKILETFVLI